MKLTIGDTEIGYDRSGTGEPLILVMGLGTPRIGWFPQFAVLSDRYDVVTFDNRGVGETRRARSRRWTMPDMAGDVLAHRRRVRLRHVPSRRDLDGRDDQPGARADGARSASVR